MKWYSPIIYSCVKRIYINNYQREKSLQSGEWKETCAYTFTLSKYCRWIPSLIDKYDISIDSLSRYACNRNICISSCFHPKSETMMIDYLHSLRPSKGPIADLSLPLIFLAYNDIRVAILRYFIWIFPRTVQLRNLHCNVQKLGRWWSKTEGSHIPKWIPHFSMTLRLHAYQSAAAVHCIMFAFDPDPATESNASARWYASTISTPKAPRVRKWVADD